MHPTLLKSLQNLQDHYAKDERCLGMFLKGSIGAGTTDEWSDVDLDAVFRDEDYAAARDEVRAVCESLCGPILVWLPEGESDDSVNYAFLFEDGGRTHLYDFAVASAGHVKRASWLRPQRILFDRTGLLAEAARRAPTPTFNPADLLHQINIYFVYAYLSGKYFKRADAYKMIYVQQVIFQTHLRVLNAFYPDAQWNWWARDVQSLPPEKQAELLVYFGANQCGPIARALQTELDLFSRDAQAACARYDVRYPAELERGVREHFDMMGLCTEANT
jgi:hypothetical protein